MRNTPKGKEIIKKYKVPKEKIAWAENHFGKKVVSKSLEEVAKTLEKIPYGIDHRRDNLKGTARQTAKDIKEIHGEITFEELKTINEGYYHTAIYNIAESKDRGFLNYANNSHIN